jgi:adenine-specific DNA-methyltransferase
MNEIFGEENFITTFIWEKRTTRENRRAFSVSHDYVLCFTRSKDHFEARRGLLPLSEAAESRYSNPDNDPRGPWQSVSLNAQAGHATPDQFYTITTPGGRVLDPPPGRCWTVTRRRLDELIADNRIWFGADGMNVPRQKYFLSESSEGLTPHTLWKASEVGTNDSAKKHLLDLLDGADIFDTPKPVGLLQRIIQIGAPSQDDLLMDFFAGSGTLAEAVFRATLDDGVQRRFLLVQLPEHRDDGRNLADSLRDRVTRASKRALADPRLTGELHDAGFRSYFLSHSNFVAWDPTRFDDVAEQLALAVDNVAAHATEHSMLTELLLKAGHPLTASIETADFSGVPGYIVDGGALVVCLSRALTLQAFEAMVETEGARAILVLDSGFGGKDELKVNALQTVRSWNQGHGTDISLKVV